MSIHCEGVGKLRKTKYLMVEPRGLEPLTFALPVRLSVKLRSPEMLVFPHFLAFSPLTETPLLVR